MGKWGNGVLECWSDGFLAPQYSITPPLHIPPLLHYSNVSERDFHVGCSTRALYNQKP
jgi:hypothetical protein